MSTQLTIEIGPTLYTVLVAVIVVYGIKIGADIVDRALWRTERKKL